MAVDGLSAEVRGSGSADFTTGADAETSWPGIWAVSAPGSLGAANNARPVASVVTFCPPESSTTTLGNMRPAASSTASVAGTPATIFVGGAVERGEGDCTLGASWTTARTGNVATRSKMPRVRYCLPQMRRRDTGVGFYREECPARK